MEREIPTIYDSRTVEARATEIWEEGQYFHADEMASGDAYTIVIPPPNVTAALHLGHALNNTLQDILIRWRRMQGYVTLWMPGTDHAGIATQTVVEKRLLAEQGKRRTEFGREEFVAHVQKWKDEYEACILGQLKQMGCSCDWPRTRFTMDDVCARAVRTNFFNLFKDGLIYRGKRLVNWDPATQTVLADDEVEHETVQGYFWYMQYPLVEPVEVCGTAFQAVDESAEHIHGQDAHATTGRMPVPQDGHATTGRMPVPQDARATLRKRQGAYLPHWTKEGATYAVSFRLADSLPAQVLAQWKAERDRIFSRAEAQGRALTEHEQDELARLYSERVESYLDAGHGKCSLRDARVAELVADALKHFNGQRYNLIAWAVMPNHVHVILKPYGGTQLPDILHSWKSYTANKANQVLGQTGEFWQPEYYDHLIRDERDFFRQVTYVLDNPTNAGLDEWPWVGMAPEKHGRDARATHGQDARATHGQDGRATHGQDGHATTGKMPVPRVITHVTVATTRPETMLGDTAVAMNPADPRAAALVGKMVRLPIVGRLIPIVADEHVVLPDPDSDDEKAKFSTGFLKVTPAHDPDDWAIGQRHDLDVINVMAPDGSISEKYGWTDWENIKNPDVENVIGMDRFEAREAIVEWFRQENLLEDVRDYAHEVGHSYRSHVPIEPYLSDQWYIAVKKPIENFQISNFKFQFETVTKDDVTYISGTDVPVNSLAGLALAPLLDGKLRFIPERYTKNYQGWLENLRDWPISRQLWWGHRIPVWYLPWEGPVAFGSTDSQIVNLKLPFLSSEENQRIVTQVIREGEGPIFFAICVEPGYPEIEEKLLTCGAKRDEDVLDTWFSSALWPFSTMGWPESNATLKKFYPTDVLCTAREIITLWVSRMVMMGQYCVGDIPFGDVYIHAMIQDGQGRKMSKSLGNGIDPLVAIDSHGADAMRFTLASMTTDTQDVRMPVAELELPDGRKVNSSPKFDLGRNFCNKLWNASRFAMLNLEGMDVGAFRAGKLDATDKWILSRLMRTIKAATDGLGDFKYKEPLDEIYKFFWNDFCDWYLEWAKPRMRGTAFQVVEGSDAGRDDDHGQDAHVTDHGQDAHATDHGQDAHATVATDHGQDARDTAHGQDARATAQNVLAFVLDQTLRLLHPFVPFITEGIFQNLNAIVPQRGLQGIRELSVTDAIMIAEWPAFAADCVDDEIERRIEIVQGVIRSIREVRSQYNIAPSKTVGCSASASKAMCELLNEYAGLIRELGGCEPFTVAADLQKPENAAAAVAGEVQVYVHDVIDPEEERKRLEKQKAFVEKGIKPLEAKLDNENFVNKAKPDVVEQSRKKLAELQEQLAAIEKHLNELK